MRRAALGPLLVAAALLAGCSEPATRSESPDDLDGRTSNPGAFSSDTGLQAEVCQGLVVGLLLPEQVLSPELPSGYVPTYAGTSGVGFVEVEAFRCGMVQVVTPAGNVTITDVVMASIGVQVEGPVGTTYRWETYVQEPAPGVVAATYLSQGWPIAPATIDLRLDGVGLTTATARIDVTASNVQRTNPGAVYVDNVLFRDADDVEHRLLEGVSTGADGTTFGPAVVRAEGSVLGRLAGTGVLAGVANPVTSTWAVGFAEQAAP